MAFLSNVLFVLFAVVVIYKFYKHRHQFKGLSKGEWGKYLFGFVLGVVVASIVIFAGQLMLKLYVSGWAYSYSKIIVIFLGLMLGSSIFLKFIPPALKSFYKI